jgi:PIN domain nuclease of toxin-antitoxin system
MIVLDTHTLVWWTQHPALLSANAARAIDRADRVLVPAICFWETALLIRKERLALNRGQPVADWAAGVLAIPRVYAVPLSAELVLAADALSMHADPADRFIVATAVAEGCSLVTKDDLLRRIGWLKTIW